MVILSDCISHKDDEGYVKIANSVIKGLKAKLGNKVKVISLSEKTQYVDIVMRSNRLLCSRELSKQINNQDVLYMSPGSNSVGTALRLALLGVQSKSLTTVFVQKIPMKISVKVLLFLSRVKIICMSRVTFDFYKYNTWNSVNYIPVGLDKNKFKPVSKENKHEIRKKYGISDNEIVVLHVGHMKKGRNIEVMLQLPEKYTKVIVTSSSTEHEDILSAFLDRKDIMIIDDYVEDISEVYKMSDIYFFPVEDESNCIGIPLSITEAAACNIGILTTKFGDIQYIKETPSLRFFNSTDSMVDIVAKIENILNVSIPSNKEIVSSLDWQSTLLRVESVING